MTVITTYKDAPTRTAERTDDRGRSISVTAFRNQLKAIHTWGRHEVALPS